MALLVFRERLRADAARTLAYFREQGVEVRVLSGDDPGTVTAVAEAAGLAAGPGVDARTLPEDPAAFAEAVLGHRVLGRVTPAQKRAAVHALQAAGRTVAMTGDGVNDALAVKDADLGIAMGSGAAATKAVSRLVLLDDAFAHLPHVVAEGRKVTANVERVSVLFLTKTTYAMALSAVLGLLLVQTPFLPRQLFITDGLTIGIPAVLLALLPSSRRYRPGFLRRALGFAVPNGLIVAACLVTLTLAARTAGIGIDAVRTCTTFVLTAVGLWVLSCQARPLRGARLLILIGMVGAAIALFTFPPTAAFLAFAAPPDGFAALSAAVAAAGCLAVEVTYRVRRRRVAA